MRLLAASMVLAVGASFADPAAPNSTVDADVKVVRSIGHEGQNGAAAAQAVNRLSQASAEQIPTILAGFKDANPLAANLLRSVVESIVDRETRTGKKLSQVALEAFVKQTQQDPRARRFAYEMIVKADPTAGPKLLAGMLTDPSPELRRDAVAQRLAEAKTLADGEKKEEAKAAYEAALQGAIHDDQVRTIVDALKTYGVEVDVAKHFGFLRDWQVIGPFDNRGMKGFAAAYPPETGVDLKKAYEGQLGEVSWKPVATEDPFGKLDIAKSLENYKGSAMYFTADFVSDKPQDVELRLGTPNAWKLWVNGKLLFGREEYHRGEELDQYRVPVKLQKGSNRILLKLLQNEQTEDWAQDFNFRLRVSDSTGRAVLPAGTASE